MFGLKRLFESGAGIFRNDNPKEAQERAARFDAIRKLVPLTLSIENAYKQAQEIQHAGKGDVPGFGRVYGDILGLHANFMMTATYHIADPSDQEASERWRDTLVSSGPVCKLVQQYYDQAFPKPIEPIIPPPQGKKLRILHAVPNPPKGPQHE